MERLSAVDADWSHASTFGSLENEWKKEPENVDNLRCNCEKTQCLERDCKCFAADFFCEEVCKCTSCLNIPDYEDTVSIAKGKKEASNRKRKRESRNPCALTPKITWTTARHRTGCNGMKSSCVKKYCECYKGDVACTEEFCRCGDCQNTPQKNAVL